MALFPRIVTKNWQLKLSAVAMAVLLWTVPRFEAQSSRAVGDIPVRIELNDPHWALVGEPSPATVTVTLSGPARELMALSVDRPPVLVPIDDVSSGDTTVLLRHAWFRGSAREGVVVEDLLPRAVSLTFEEIRQRPLPLATSYSGALPQGLSLAGPPTLDPEAVVVFGPESRLQEMDSVRLTPIDLSMVAGGDTLIGTVDTTAVRGLNVLPLEVAVYVPTEPTVAREFSELTVDLPDLDSGPQLQARPNVVNVVVVGAQSLVEALDPEGITATIPTARASLAPGQEERVVVVVEGLPDLVESRVTPVWILVQRPVGQ